MICMEGETVKKGWDFSSSHHTVKRFFIFPLLRYHSLGYLKKEKRKKPVMEHHPQEEPEQEQAPAPDEATETTEVRKICPFFRRMGACRHGDTCSRWHRQPRESYVALLKNMYYCPTKSGPAALRSANSKDVNQVYFEDFYAEVYEELLRYGDIINMKVLANTIDHLAGNTYVEFASKRAAETCVRELRGRWFAGRQVHAELSPVQDFEEGRCRQFDERECRFGGDCNFMHIKKIGRSLFNDMEHQRRKRRRRRDEREDNT